MNFDLIDIDNNFIYILQEKINIINNKNITKKEVNALLNISKYIDKLKPKSKCRAYKEQIITYVNERNRLNISTKDIIYLNKIYLSDVIIMLQSEHNFYEKNNRLISVLFSALFDLVLFVIGFSEFYYYVPVISIIRGVLIIRKAKRYNKYIDI